MSAAVSESAQSSDRLDWVRQMRLNFSPTGMCDAEGDIVQDFFKPKTVILQLQEEQRWGDAEREALYQGIEQYGIGAWRDMLAVFPALARYDEQTLRHKAARLMGAQSLARFIGWRGSRTTVDALYSQHKALGVELGLWKGGVLVDDGSGALQKALAQCSGAGQAQR